jgi:hypothetical protein
MQMCQVVPRHVRKLQAAKYLDVERLISIAEVDGMIEDSVDQDTCGPIIAKTDCGRFASEGNGRLLGGGPPTIVGCPGCGKEESPHAT